MYEAHLCLTPKPIDKFGRSPREKILGIEKCIWELPRVETPTEHVFAPGVYIRKMHIPAGTIVSGKVHLTEHASLCVKGHLAMFTEEGVADYRAGDHVISKPGTKRVAYAHEDSIWVTVHPTNKTDVDELEKELVVETYEDLLGLETLCRLAQSQAR